MKKSKKIRVTIEFESDYPLYEIKEQISDAVTQAFALPLVNFNLEANFIKAGDPDMRHPWMRHKWKEQA